MMHRITLPTLGLLLSAAGIAIGIGRAEQQGPYNVVTTTADTPNPTDPAMIGLRVKAIEREHSRLREELLGIRDRYDQIPAEGNHRAAGLLLKFEPESAMPFLVQHIDWTCGANFKFDFGPYEEHPHARALWSQGSAAIPAILRHLRLAPADSVSDRKIELFAFQILCVHGFDDVGRERAVHAATTTDAHKIGGADARENMRRLTEKLKSLPKFVVGR